MTKQGALKKQGRLKNNFKKVLLEFVSSHPDQDFHFDVFMEVLGVPPKHLILLEALLNEMVQEGLLSEKRKRGESFFSGKILPGLPTLKGTISLHHRGFGFVQPEKGQETAEEVFIPAKFTENAVTGDVVEVTYEPSRREGKGPEGKVVAILERGREHLAGTILYVQEWGTFAYAPLLGPDKQVRVTDPEGNFPNLRRGDRIILYVQDWGSGGNDPVGIPTHHMGHMSDPSIDVVAAIEEHALRSDFPVAVIEEARKVGKRISQKEITRREDFREWEVVTIDPETARDFDDAISLTENKKGYELGVHIADVSHYVKAGTALDEEATIRCNSTYFPGRCVPMLPSELSNEMCSLKPNVNRLTFSVVIQLDHQGNTLSYRIVEGVIKSQKRFTYEGALAVLEGRRKSRHKDLLDRMVKVCHLFKKKRFERGSIEFALPEVVIKVDAEGQPTGLESVDYDITHQMIEEFMLKANETVASHLSKEGIDLTYRIHDKPDPSNMEQFAFMAGMYGFDLPAEPSSEDLQKLFDEVRSSEHGHRLAIQFIKSMKLAAYSPHNIGHYGLGLKHYCHFTSPIRRYADLIVHRILRGQKEELNSLEAVSAKCSTQERQSARAETSVILLKKLRYLIQLMNEDSHREFEAVITSVREVGIAFEVVETQMEGFLHISRIGEDFYVFDESSGCLRGSYSSENFGLGSKILVAPTNIDLIMMECQWERVPSEEPSPSRKPKGGDRKMKKGKDRKFKGKRRHS